MSETHCYRCGFETEELEVVREPVFFDGDISYKEHHYCSICTRSGLRNVSVNFDVNSNLERLAKGMSYIANIILSAHTYEACKEPYVFEKDGDGQYYLIPRRLQEKFREMDGSAPLREMFHQYMCAAGPGHYRMRS